MPEVLHEPLEVCWDVSDRCVNVVVTRQIFCNVVKQRYFNEYTNIVQIISEIHSKRKTALPLNHFELKHNVRSAEKRSESTKCASHQDQSRNALWRTGVPSSVYSHLTPRVPGIHSGSTVSLLRIKMLLKMNEWINELVNEWMITRWKREIVAGRDHHIDLNGQDNV